MTKQTPTTDRIRGFYKAATAWTFDKDAEPHILAMQEKQAEEFDEWLNSVKAEVWREGRNAGVDDMIAADLGVNRRNLPNPYEAEEDRHVD